MALLNWAFTFHRVISSYLFDWNFNVKYFGIQASNNTLKTIPLKHVNIEIMEEYDARTSF